MLLVLNTAWGVSGDQKISTLIIGTGKREGSSAHRARRAPIQRRRLFRSRPASRLAASAWRVIVRACLTLSTLFLFVGNQGGGPRFFASSVCTYQRSLQVPGSARTRPCMHPYFPTRRRRVAIEVVQEERDDVERRDGLFSTIVRFSLRRP
jgi:hypothetical protein